jgi:hypothetical protein
VNKTHNVEKGAKWVQTDRSIDSAREHFHHSCGENHPPMEKPAATLEGNPRLIPCPATREGRELFGIGKILHTVDKISSSKSFAVPIKDGTCTRVLVKSSI